MTTNDELRQRLVSRGAEALSDAQLIALLLQENGPASGALDTARRILESFGGDLAALASSDVARLRMCEGIGVRRAAVLSAACELGRRAGVAASQEVTSVETDEDVVRIFHPLLAHLAHEEFWVVYLTASNRIVERRRISQGGVSGTVVDYRLVVKRAVELLCGAMVLVHNHPSGSARPSESDMTLTERIVRASALFDIKVVDHVIVSSSESYSLLRHGRMPE